MLRFLSCPLCVDRGIFDVSDAFLVDARLHFLPDNALGMYTLSTRLVMRAISISAEDRRHLAFHIILKKRSSR